MGILNLVYCYLFLFVSLAVVEVFQDDLDKLSDVGKKDKLLKFFKFYEMENSL
jgi:hypothetical protein